MGTGSQGVRVEGVVVEGDHRGRLLGFPTANLEPDPDVELPEDGVYAGNVLRANGERYVAAISIGRRRTYYGENALRLLEAHLLEFDDDLYGERIVVSVGARVRGQAAFSTSEALVAQIADDVAKVRELSESDPLA